LHRCRSDQRFPFTDISPYIWFVPYEQIMEVTIIATSQQRFIVFLWYRVTIIQTTLAAVQSLFRNQHPHAWMRTNAGRSTSHTSLSPHLIRRPGGAELGRQFSTDQRHLNVLQACPNITTRMSQKSPTFKVIIVGAGIGGIACAVECKRKGYDVSMYDAARSFARLGDTIGVYPHGQAYQCLSADFPTARNSYIGGRRTWIAN